MMREELMNQFYERGLSWRVYDWYVAGGIARALSIFIGQSIKFWRHAL